MKVASRTFHFEALAVMSHHTPYYDDLYKSKYRDQVLGQGRYCLDRALKFYWNAPQIHLENLGYPYPFQLGDPPFGQKADYFLDHVISELYLYPPKEIRDIHSLFVAALHYCDWLASMRLDGYKYCEEAVSEKARFYLGQSSEFKGLYDFQREASVEGNILLKAPTGRGKTEAALLWAGSNAAGGKILYLLPTRVTTNAIYKRLCKFCGENVGMSHGTSALMIAEDEKWDEARYRWRNLLSSTFMLPITVATVDQLLLAQFNWRQWEMVEQNASHAAIIFDEIHAYDPYTTALILIAAKSLTNRNARIAFMSATFPTFLQGSIKVILGGSITLISDTGSSQRRHRVSFLNQPIHESIPAILSDYKAGKHVLVVMNTVEGAIDFYRSLKTLCEKDPHIILYHSRFIELDRREKEGIIENGAQREGGFIAVTTQVAEVSLDIDYDVLYTQLAPVDALIQRMGRTNRKGKKAVDGESNVFIYESGPTDNCVYGGDNLKLAHSIVEPLDKTLVTDEDVSRLVERQYPPEIATVELDEAIADLKKSLRELRMELWHIQAILLSDKDRVLRRLAKTRDDGLPTVEAIPLCFKDIVEKLGHPLEAIGYYVRLPLSKFGGSLQPEENKLFANIQYDKEYGATGPVVGDNVI